MIGNVKTFAARPEIAGSPAAKNGKIYLWKANDMFRYGLDTPQVIQRLHGLANKRACLKKLPDFVFRRLDVFLLVEEAKRLS